MPATASLSPRRVLSASLIVVVLAMLLSAALSVIPGADGAANAATRSKTTTKSLRYVSNWNSLQGAINQCRGGVATDTDGFGSPWLIVEHDYCGGAWVLPVRKGDRLKVRNGALAGVWKATGRTRIIGHNAPVTTTRGLGYLVVQTCIPHTNKIKLVGFSRTGR